MFLTQHQLPVMCEICCEFFVFQQNNLPVDLRLLSRSLRTFGHKLKHYLFMSEPWAHLRFFKVALYKFSHYNMSTHWARTAAPPCQCLPFKPSKMGETHVYFIKHVASTPRSESSELQNLRRNAAEGLSLKKFMTSWHVWYGFEPRISNSVTDD